MATIQTRTARMTADFGQQASTTQTYTIPAGMSCPFAFDQGTASNCVNLLYAKTHALAASNLDLDLASLTDVAGNSINFARVRFIMIRNESTTAGHNLTIGAAASNAWTALLGTSTSTIVLPPGIAASGNNPPFYSTFSAADPLSSGGTGGFIVGASSKVLQLAPGANSFNVSVLIAGTSANS